MGEGELDEGSETLKEVQTFNTRDVMYNTINIINTAVYHM